MGKQKGRVEEAGAHRERYDILALLRDIISCILLMAAVGGWTLLCLLVLSFIFVSTGIFHIKWMLPLSIAAGVLMGVYYVIRTIKRNY